MVARDNAPTPAILEAGAGAKSPPEPITTAPADLVSDKVSDKVSEGALIRFRPCSRPAEVGATGKMDGGCVIVCQSLRAIAGPNRAINKAVIAIGLACASTGPRLLIRLRLWPFYAT